MAALEEEGKLLATSSSSWYGLIKVHFFLFFFACYMPFSSPQRDSGDFGLQVQQERPAFFS